MIPLRIRLVDQDHCPICVAALQVVRKHAKPPTTSEVGERILQARAHMVTALIIGFRREDLDVCAFCKALIEKSAAAIEAKATDARRLIIP